MTNFTYQKGFLDSFVCETQVNGATTAKIDTDPYSAIHFKIEVGDEDTMRKAIGAIASTELGNKLLWDFFKNRLEQMTKDL